MSEKQQDGHAMSATGRKQKCPNAYAGEHVEAEGIPGCCALCGGREHAPVCLHCGEPVRQAAPHIEPDYWVHVGSGIYCRPTTVATPATARKQA